MPLKNPRGDWGLPLYNGQRSCVSRGRSRVRLPRVTWETFSSHSLEHRQNKVHNVQQHLVLWFTESATKKIPVLHRFQESLPIKPIPRGFFYGNLGLRSCFINRFHFKHVHFPQPVSAAASEFVGKYLFWDVLHVCLIYLHSGPVLSICGRNNTLNYSQPSLMYHFPHFSDIYGRNRDTNSNWPFPQGIVICHKAWRLSTQRPTEMEKKDKK
jgi:hypothetical protein